MKNVLEWLEKTAAGRGDQTAWSDLSDKISFKEVNRIVRSIGTALAEKVPEKAPIAVFSARACRTPAYFLGVTASGHTYAPLDSHLPKERLEKILNSLQPSAILTDADGASAARELAGAIPVLSAEELCETAEDPDLLAKIRREAVSTDPLYIIYTSGSTGIPKGVITSNDSLIRYIDAYAGVMGIDEKDILGNQSPLDYIAAIRDIYLPLKTGCSSVIIPKEYFMSPDRLFTFMNERGVTSVGWCASAFTVLTSLGAFEDRKLASLRKICFSGSVMPGKCLKKWQENLPGALFVNQYGPTEATASCTYYVVDHTVQENETLPIGRAYENYRVFLLKEDNKEALPGEEGEICVSGPCLALGYYRDPVRTAASFIQNPLQSDYQERIYRTGDIGVMREDGILEFHGRRDRQIKHMGHRVELDEIDAAASAVPGVQESLCLYLAEKEKLCLFVSGSIDKKSLLLALRKTLPDFMIPRGVTLLPALPKLDNGKTDMRALREMMH